jgi:hypothetical protein
MKKEFNIETCGFRLRSAVQSDLELLRNAKNSNKNSFFLQQDITEDQQKKWFEKFCENENDFMLILENVESNVAYGCMGFRLMDDVIDGYNIIRIKDLPNTSIKDAFIVLIKEAKLFFGDLTFQVRVLKSNPAIGWYEKIGFTKISEETNFITMYYNVK